MDHNLKVAVVPLDIAWGDRDENLYVATGLIRKVEKDVDVIVLPELFATGFVTEASQLYDLADSAQNHPTMTWAAGIAQQKNAAVCGTTVWNDNGHFTNRAFFVEPSGEVSFYDKRHLFALSNEADVYTAGKYMSPIVRFRSWNIAMAICYDLRFPCWLRNLNAKYDLLLVPANWPDARAFVWNQLLSARAIENQAYVVGANRAGKDDYGQYDMAQIVDYHGKAIARQDADSRQPFSSTLSLEAVTKARKTFPVLDDADPTAIVCN